MKYLRLFVLTALILFAWLPLVARVIPVVSPWRPGVSVFRDVPTFISFFSELFYFLPTGLTVKFTTIHQFAVLHLPVCIVWSALVSLCACVLLQGREIVEPTMRSSPSSRRLSGRDPSRHNAGAIQAVTDKRFP